MNRANIELYIEELVLHGFSAGDRYRIAEAVQGELTRLFAEQGLPPTLVQSGDIRQIDAGGFEIAAGSAGNVVGGQIADRVHSGLSGEQHTADSTRVRRSQ
jgi:hypothetical protein